MHGAHGVLLHACRASGATAGSWRRAAATCCTCRPRRASRPGGGPSGVTGGRAAGSPHQGPRSQRQQGSPRVGARAGGGRGKRAGVGRSGWGGPGRARVCLYVRCCVDHGWCLYCTVLYCTVLCCTGPAFSERSLRGEARLAGDAMQAIAKERKAGLCEHSAMSPHGLYVRVASRPLVWSLRCGRCHPNVGLPISV